MSIFLFEYLIKHKKQIRFQLCVESEKFHTCGLKFESRWTTTFFLDFFIQRKIGLIKMQIDSSRDKSNFLFQKYYFSKF